MKLLVTGGAGFIGSAVVRLAVSRGHHPRQTWYVMAAAPGDLPDASMDRHLTGATWRVAEMKTSLKVGA